MEDENVMREFLQQMKELFGDDIGNPEQTPLTFNYQCRITKRHIERVKREKQTESQAEGTGDTNNLSVPDANTPVDGVTIDN